MVRRTAFIVALVVALIEFASLPAAAQSGRTFYIDYASGSNSNPGTKTSPWKTHPYMSHSAGCDSSSGPAYTHAAGDRFIFKGGVTWPAACFTLTVAAGGTASAQDYYGVDQTWFNGSSWTRPLWDINYISVYYVVNASSSDSGYTTFDNIEIQHQGIQANVAEGYDSQEAFNFYYGATGTILENLYIHDWATSNEINTGICNPSSGGCLTNYDIGAVHGSQNKVDPGPTAGIRLLNSTITDQNGYLYSGGVRKNIPFGGACVGCYEVSGDTFSYTMAACFDVLLCHDSEFSHVDAGLIELYDSSIHSQVIEDDGAGNSTVYNNYIHDNPAAVTMLLCPGSPFFNNVVSNSTNQPPLRIDADFCYATSPASATENVYNNTFDCTATGGCIRYTRTGETYGTVNEYNNIYINGGVSVEATITHYNHSNNYTMGTSEANSYGFTSANKYDPSSSDSNIVAQGTNLSSSCSAALVPLCNDTAGAAWFGGSSAARLTQWDLGAYQFSPQSSSRPNPPSNLTATVQ